MSRKRGRPAPDAEATFSEFTLNMCKELLCPITLCLPVDPVLAEDGRVYERSAIGEWFTTHRRSPWAPQMHIGKSLVAAVQTRNLIEMLVESGRLPDAQSREWREGRAALAARQARSPSEKVSYSVDETDEATAYVHRVRRRFGSAKYRQFVELLRRAQRNQLSIAELWRQASVLLADHRDLLRDFQLWLPDGWQAGDSVDLDDNASFVTPAAAADADDGAPLARRRRRATTTAAT
jgi:hypothetical protein